MSSTCGVSVGWRWLSRNTCSLALAESMDEWGGDGSHRTEGDRAK